MSPEPAGTTDPAATTSSDPVSESTDTGPAETSVKDIPDGLPEDKKFDGAPYTIMIPNPSFRAKYRYDLTEDEITDSLDQACYDRTKAIEERFGVKFTMIEGTGNGKEFTKLSDFAAAGEYAVDLVIPNGNGYGKAGTAIINGLVPDWDTLPYVDLTKPWWSSGLIDSLRINGKAYAAFGDINVTRAFYGAMIFNKSLFDDVQEAYPYETVQSGKWTYDELLRLNAKATKDLDGNGTFDENDRYGLLANESFLGNFQMYWGTSEVVKLDKNGQRSLDVPAEKIQTIADRVLSMLDTGNVYDQHHLRASAHGSGTPLLPEAGSDEPCQELRHLEKQHRSVQDRGTETRRPGSAGRLQHARHADELNKQKRPPAGGLFCQ